MALTLIELGIPIEVQHHEVGTAGQAEIDMRFGSLLAMADNVMNYKYVVKNAAWRAGKTATFMPKPLFADNGSGMHVHQSFWKNGQNRLLQRGGYAGLSDLARYYIGGLLKHAPALLRSAHRPPTPTAAWSPDSRRRSTSSTRSATAPPAFASRCTRKAPRRSAWNIRLPDPTANPYLAFSALLMAGLDGIRNKIEPPDPIDKDLYELDARGGDSGQAGAGFAGGSPRRPGGGSRVPHSKAASSPRI